MKKLFFFVAPALLLACSGTTETIATPQKDPSIGTNDTLVTVTASIDGLDNIFYIEKDPGTTVLEKARLLHVLPNVYEDSAAVDPYMFSIVKEFFFFNESFNVYTGPVTVFYDATRKHIAAEFSLVNGVAEGQAKAYDTTGKLVIERVYGDGWCVQSIKDLYAIDWLFDSPTSSLEISGLENYEYRDNNGNRLIKLGESMHPNTTVQVNQLYALIEKEVFDNVFKINKEPYTGKLVGYFSPSESESLLPYFELSFVEGWLHDTIRVYSEVFGLELEERFENGVLVETIYQLDESELDGVAKPIVYIYPEQETIVNVQLDFDGALTHSYPVYPSGGWNMKAMPDGTLYDKTGKEFYALFWEGETAKKFSYSEGFVIKGDETAEFLEKSLDVIGLTRREANEFIMYWLPQMENNNYNLIHFSTKEYEEIAELKITPKPESVIRVMMVWSPLESKIEMPQQNLFDMKVERKGFTVVEWGGKMQEFSSQTEL